MAAMSSEPRRAFALPVPVELVRADGTSQMEWAVNLSPHGVCLHLRKGLSVGEVIRVSFTVPPDGPDVRSRGRVVWAMAVKEEGTEHHIETGVHLLDLPAELVEQLREWASRPAHRRR
jgi:hypothetical protein